MVIESLLKYIKQFVELNNEEISNIKNRVRVRNYLKRQCPEKPTVAQFSFESLGYLRKAIISGKVTYPIKVWILLFPHSQNDPIPV